jgi:hypothetical protein
MQVVRLLVVAVAGVLGLAWLAKGRASGKVKRAAFRAMLLGILALLAWSGPEVLAQRRIEFDVAVLLVASILLAYLYLVRFCPACGLMQRNLKPAACARCGAALPRHGMTSALRRTGLEPRRPGRFLGPPRQ